MTLINLFIEQQNYPSEEVSTWHKISPPNIAKSICKVIYIRKNMSNHVCLKITKKCLGCNNLIWSKVITGRILAREGAAMPTNPSLGPGLRRTMLVTLFPKSQCHIPTSFSGRKTLSISMDPDMKHIEPSFYLSTRRTINHSKNWNFTLNLKTKFTKNRSSI